MQLLKKLADFCIPRRNEHIEEYETLLDTKKDSPAVMLGNVIVNEMNKKRIVKDLIKATIEGRDLVIYFSGKDIKFRSTTRNKKR